jgi:hypothetical protein
LARLRLPVQLGGNANVLTYVSIANDTGSDVQTVFTTDLANLQYDPNIYRGNLPAIYVNTAGGVVLRQRIILEVQLLKADGSVVSPWIQEVGVITAVQQGVQQYRLSGNAMRNFLYFGTAPGNAQLYVAEKKNGLVSQLPVL